MAIEARPLLIKAGGFARNPRQRRLYHEIFDLVDRLPVNDRMRVLRAISVRYQGERELVRLNKLGIHENVFGDDKSHDEEDGIEE